MVREGSGRRGVSGEVPVRTDPALILIPRHYTDPGQPRDLPGERGSLNVSIINRE